MLELAARASAAGVLGVISEAEGGTEDERVDRCNGNGNTGLELFTWLAGLGRAVIESSPTSRGGETLMFWSTLFWELMASFRLGEDCCFFPVLS